MSQNQLSDQQIAELYVIQKQIESVLKTTNLPHSNRFDVSGKTVEITLPNNISVLRGKGSNGDGTNEKKATSNLNGYAILYAMTRYLSKFNQQNVVRDELMKIVEDAVNSDISSENQFRQEFPDEAQSLADFRKQWSEQMPTRTETTPKRITNPDKGLLEVKFKDQKNAA